MSMLPENVPDTYLFDLMRRDIQDRIVSKMLEEIRPQVVDIARQAVDELDATMHKHFDARQDATVFTLLVKDPTKK